MNPLAQRWREGREPDELVIVVLYDSPVDYPGSAVLRAQYSSARGVRPSAEPLVLKSLVQARAFMLENFRDLYEMLCDPSDAPQMVSCWL